MENYNLHRRAQSGWHPTTYSRPVDKKPERNWAALTEAAKRKPIGYWEDAPRGIQFGGGKTCSDQRERSAPVACPPAPSASSDDLYEPIGTMPVVGDMVVVLESDGTPYKDDDAGKPQRVKAVYEDECETDFCEMNMEWFKTMNPVAKIRNRILRRTKAATGARAWKSWCGYHWLLIGVKWFAASPTTGWTQFPDNWLAGSAMAGWFEQSPAEVQRLVDEAMAAMKGKS